MNSVEKHEAFKSALKSRIRFSNLEGFRVYQPVEPCDDLDDYLNHACKCYLTLGEEGRKQIRAMFDDEDTLWYLYEYIKHVCKRIRTSSDIDTLLLGLAAVSIIDFRGDDRNLIYRLGDLYFAAKWARIDDPLRLFRHVAEISNNAGQESTGKIMRNFELTEVWKEMDK